jgi:hypothetical protein
MSGRFVQEPSTSPRNDSRPWQPRFGIRELLMLMLICSILAASLGYLYQDQKGEGRSVRFIFITVAGPTMMAICLGIGYFLFELLRGKKRKRRPAKEEENPYQ